MKRNFKDIRILSNGHGHWHITMRYKKRDVSLITNNARAIDDYRSGEWERDENDGRIFKRTRGYDALRQEIIAEYEKSKIWKQ